MEIRGVVQRGKGRGAGLGFATANLAIADAPGVAFGVYAARADWGEGWRGAVANVGAHPTLPDGPPTVEVHVLGDTPDLYGRQVRVRLGRFIRPEMRFDSVAALQAQVRRDIAAVRALGDADA